MMLINDRIYGTFEIKNDLLVELVNSQTMQRLKDVGQYGVPDEWYHFKNYSRFEHCVGVMMLLKTLGASIEEQTAGLLHDASHLAFSHVADWVFDRKEKEDFQDNIHSKFLRENGEIVTILEKHGLDVGKISRLENYGLLERPAPELCADRVDYALRDFANHDLQDYVRRCFSGLVVFGGRIAFSSKDTAKKFAEGYLKCQIEHYGSPETLLRYHLLSTAIKIALRKNLIKKSDLFQTDSFVIKKLKSVDDKELKGLLKQLSRPLKFSETDNYETDKNAEIVILKKKFRYVDPLYISGNKPIRLSETDSEYASVLQEAKKKQSAGVKIKLMR